jgi:hypothetical protein
MKSDYIHMRCHPTLKSAIRKEAERRHIDTSSMISLVLAEWLERNRSKRVDLSNAAVAE